MTGPDDFGRKSYPAGRFPPQKNMLGDYESPYDVSNEVIQDAASRGLRPVTVVLKDLASASQAEGSSATPPTAGDWIPIENVGHHVTLFGSDASANQAVNTTAFMEMLPQDNQPARDDVGFPLKHNRGFSGPFRKIWVRWPAQAGVKARLVFFRFKGRPWISGEAAT